MVKCSPTCPVFLATTPLSQLEAIQQGKQAIQPPMGMTDLGLMGIHQTQAVKPQGPQVDLPCPQTLQSTFLLRPLTAYPMVQPNTQAQVTVRPFQSLPHQRVIALAREQQIQAQICWT